MSKEIVYPIILCGGSGSRLWPLSRSSFPKQYLTVNSDQKTSFLQRTVLRIKEIKNMGDPIIICNEEHRFIVAEQMLNIKVNPKTILLEPCGRNTAPAITLGALKAIEISETDPILFVVPADHVIKNTKKFYDVINSSIEYASKEKLVTLGVIPDRAETGFGYIEAKDSLDYKSLKGQEINSFIEKPNKENAEKLILDKKYSWNSGMFLFKASIILKEIKKNYPSIYNFCKKSIDAKILDLDFQRIDKSSFSLCESISLDKAVMEKTKNGIVLPLDVGWSDIGSWQSMWEVSEKDKNNNVISENVFIDNVKNSYLRSEERIIVGMGIKDLIIVETADAILVAHKNDAQNVKNIVETLTLKNKKEAYTHKTIFRPWGNYTSMSEGRNWQVKKITVNPGQSLSLQLHKHRTEHWIIVSGEALVEINNKKMLLKENQSTYIPLLSKHRLSNPGKNYLVLIEVQSGDYLGEDDIVRFADNYGRNINK